MLAFEGSASKDVALVSGISGTSALETERGARSSAPLHVHPARADRFAAGRFERFFFFPV